MPMRPLLLKGHERPLTTTHFNRQGDILVTCAKDHKPNVWFTENGERLGTLAGHNGAVMDCSLTWDSKYLLTASFDQTCKWFDIETGEMLFTWDMRSPCRSCDLAQGDRRALVVTDPFMGSKPTINVINVNKDGREHQDTEIVTKCIGDGKARIMKARWGPLNEYIVSVGEDMHVRKWDPLTGECIASNKIHDATINDLKWSKDMGYFITASTDRTAKLVDADSLEILKTYDTERPCNAASIHPVFDHVIAGGGQDAAAVTTTSSKAGKFENVIFHKIFEDIIGTVKGHFGPVNDISWSPDGRTFASGAEDGYVRIHHMDDSYIREAEKQAKVYAPTG